MTSEQLLELVLSGAGVPAGDVRAELVLALAQALPELVDLYARERGLRVVAAQVEIADERG